jgi:hypothetical protein
VTKPLRVSWSAIRTHEECHQKSFLIRDGKRAKVSNIRNFLHGSVVDVIMRRWLENPLHPAGAMVAMVDDMLDETIETEKQSGNMVRWRNADDRNELRRFCTELVTRLEPILQEHVLPFPYSHGRWFKVPMSVPDSDNVARDILLTGEMDLIVNNDGPVIWDLKGTADDQYYRKVIAQLVFYDLAVWASSGQKSRFVGLIQPMCKEPLLAWEVTEDARQQLMARIVRYCHDVWNNEKTCKDGTAGCQWCDVRHACSRYQQGAIDTFGTLADGLRAAAGEVA